MTLTDGMVVVGDITVTSDNSNSSANQSFTPPSTTSRLVCAA